MRKSVLILGGGVAGCAVSHFLKSKNYEITIVNEIEKLGGLARTEYYAGHPYEFGPHVWFWPGGVEDPINKVIHDLSEGELYFIDRKLFSYIEQDRALYKYPIHFEDFSRMPEANVILEEFAVNRDENNKLIPDNLPVIGDSTFADYFQSVIGATLYGKFMQNYTHKMWNIPGTELQTSMVWADRFNHEYSKESKEQRWIYDPIKFEDHTLGKGIAFQVYPKRGWNVIWERMSESANKIVDTVESIKLVGNSTAEIFLASGKVLSSSDYTYVVNTLDLDKFFGDQDLPYTGRLLIPLLIPSMKTVLPQNAESLHFSGAEFTTRVTEMKTITRHQSDDSLILLEIPILPGAKNSFPSNVIDNAMSKNLFAEKAYPQQSIDAIAYHQYLANKSTQIGNWLNCGRHAQFKYWGMPETVKSAYELSLTLP